MPPPGFERALRDAFNRIIKTAGVRQIRFHDMRHTNASLLIANGVDVKTVSSRLGHSTANITLNIYAKFMREADERAAGVMANIMGKKTTRQPVRAWALGRAPIFRIAT